MKTNERHNSRRQPNPGKFTTRKNGYKYDFGRFQLFFLWIRVGLGLRRSLVSYSIYMLSNPTELGS